MEVWKIMVPFQKSGICRLQPLIFQGVIRKKNHVHLHHQILNIASI